MTVEQGDVDWSRVEALFPDLLELPAAQRARFLDRHCGGDDALRRELEAMLAAAEGDSVLDRMPQVRAQADDAADVDMLDAQARIGAWRIVRLIGRGGMGEVYLAERAEGGFTQQAAIKLLHRDASQHADRFEEERRILAQLTHPNIARLLDGGFHDGRAWMAMEYIPGHDIAEHCRANALLLPARLKLFHQACAAVAHAHAALVIHRDLKPSNIMVSEAGQVKLLDFGIAKLIDPHTRSTGATHGAPFTPDHAAPEQIEGGPVTTAVDIYALGVVLYELLSGKLPWSFGDTPLSRAVDRLLREDPPPPSQAAADAPAGGLPAGELQGDLDAIVARCLRRLPQDRYATVPALQEDLDRYAQRQPVLARQGGRSYVARLWLRRHRVLAGALAIAGLSLLAGLGVALWQAGIARREAAHAQAQQRIAEAQRAQVRVQANSSLAVQELLMQMFSHAMAADGGRSTSVRDVVDMLQMMGARSLDDAARAQLLLRLARLSAVAGDTDAAQALVAQAAPLIAQAGDARPRLLAQQLDAQLVLAVSTQDLARMEAQAPPLLRLLDTFPQPLDAEMLEVKLNGLRSWGWALDQLGRADEAIAAKRQSWLALRERFGAAHARTRMAQGDLARAYALAGRYSESTRLLRESLAGQEGETSRMTRLASLIELAQSERQSTDGLPEASRLLQEAQALEAQDDRMPAFYAAWIQALQADLLREQGDLAGAAARLQAASGFRPTQGMREERGTRALVLTAQSDLAWVMGDAAGSGRHAQAGLDFLGAPASGSSSEQQKFLGLRLRVARARAGAARGKTLQAEVDAIVRELDALPLARRAPYLGMAAEALRLGSLADAAAAMAGRAVAAADAEPERNARVQAAAREQQRLASARR